MAREKRVGIYKIQFITGECYVGQSIDLYSRLRSHKYYLGRGAHTNREMQALYDQHGMPLMDILEECDPSMLNEREQYWVAFYDSYENGLNKTPGGGGKNWPSSNNTTDMFVTKPTTYVDPRANWPWYEHLLNWLFSGETNWWGWIMAIIAMAYVSSCIKGL